MGSRSGLLCGELKGSRHDDIAAQVRRLLARHADLYPVIESGGVKSLWYIEDDPGLQQDIARARRLQRFLTQPLYGAEPWTGIFGQSIDPAKTIRGCEAILAGQYDHLPEDAFYFKGTIDHVVESAAAQ